MHELSEEQLFNTATLEEFWKGKELFPGAGFIYSDDVWDFKFDLRQADKPSGRKINFGNIPDFLKNSVKAYISWGWLAMDYSLSWVHSNMTSFSHLTNYLNKYRPEITQLAMLDSGVTDGISIFLRENLSGERAYAEVGEDLFDNIHPRILCYIYE